MREFNKIFIWNLGQVLFFMIMGLLIYDNYFYIFIIFISCAIIYYLTWIFYVLEKIYLELKKKK